MSCPFGVGAHVMRHGRCGRVTEVHSLPGGVTELTVRLDTSGNSVRWPCDGVGRCTADAALALSDATAAPICGAPTRTTGRPCQRRVEGGGRCYQHS